MFDYFIATSQWWQVAIKLIQEVDDPMQDIQRGKLISTNSKQNKKKQNKQNEKTKTKTGKWNSKPEIGSFPNKEIIQ